MATIGSLHALALTIALALSQNPTGNTILGKLHSQSGQSLSNVIVELQSGNGMPVSQTVTSSEGDYVFSGLTGASFTVIVNDLHYEPFGERVEFPREATTRPGETLRLDITLIPKDGPRSRLHGLNFVQDIPKAARTSYEHALQLLRQRRNTEAVEELQSAIRLFPDYFDARLILGNELLNETKYTDAIVHLDEARRINPKDDRPYELFGIVLMRQGKYVLAARVFAEADDLNPLEPQYSFMRGVALIEHVSSKKIVPPAKLDSDALYALSEAEKSLLHAFEVSNRKLPAVHLQLARLYEKKEDKEHAAKELELYLRDVPNAPNAAAIREAIKRLRGQA
jgi:tetratricopeptide (TPR) repeat protein